MMIVFVVWPTAHKLFSVSAPNRKEKLKSHFKRLPLASKLTAGLQIVFFSTKFRLQEQSCSSLQEERVALVIDPDFVFSSSCEAANCPSDNTDFAVNSPNRAFLFTPRSDHSSKDSPLL